MALTAITALAHLDACVVFIIDLSPGCKYSIADQCHLFRTLKPLYIKKPVLVVCNKTDSDEDCQPNDFEEAETFNFELFDYKEEPNEDKLPMPFKCENCNKSFLRQSWLARHCFSHPEFNQ